MSGAEKTLEKMRRHPGDWRIEDVISVAKHFKLLMRIKGGSHYVFSLPGIQKSVSVPAHKPIKPIYIKNFIDLVEKIGE
jgi:hypothetical protein